MLISQAQTQSNIGDIADRINSVDSSMKKTEKIADIITVKRPIVRGLVLSGAIKRLVFRNGIQYDELPYQTLRSKKSRQPYLVELKQLALDLTDVYRFNGSPPLRNRTKGLGKKSEQCLT